MSCDSGCEECRTTINTDVSEGSWRSLLASRRNTTDPAFIWLAEPKGSVRTKGDVEELRFAGDGKQGDVTCGCNPANLAGYLVSEPHVAIGTLHNLRR